MQKSPESSQSSSKDPRGNLLKVNPGSSGYSSVVLDNGPFRTVTIHCHAEALGDLLAEDQQALLNHLRTRQTGHFRRKSGN